MVTKKVLQVISDLESQMKTFFNKTCINTHLKVVGAMQRNVVVHITFQFPFNILVLINWGWLEVFWTNAYRLKNVDSMEVKHCSSINSFLCVRLSKGKFSEVYNGSPLGNCLKSFMVMSFGLPQWCWDSWASGHPIVLLLAKKHCLI